MFKRDDIGDLSIGKQADLAIFNLDELRFSGVGDPIAALVMCGAHRVEKLMVAGNWVIEDAQHVVDIEASLMTTHSQLAKSLQTM